MLSLVLNNILINLKRFLFGLSYLNFPYQSGCPFFGEEDRKLLTPHETMSIQRALHSEGQLRLLRLEIR